MRHKKSSCKYCKQLKSLLMRWLKLCDRLMVWSMEWPRDQNLSQWMGKYLLSIQIGSIYGPVDPLWISFRRKDRTEVRSLGKIYTRSNPQYFIFHPLLFASFVLICSWRLLWLFPRCGDFFHQLIQWKWITRKCIIILELLLMKICWQLILLSVTT